MRRVPKFYSIMLNTGGRAVPNDRIEHILDRVVSDWLRYASNQYIVAFEGEAAALYQDLKPILHADDQIVVVKLMLEDRWGWAGPIVTQWITKHFP